MVLFCVSMTETRWTNDHIETIKKVNEALGEDVWMNTVLVLTLILLIKLTIRPRKNNFQQIF